MVSLPLIGLRVISGRATAMLVGADASSSLAAIRHTAYSKGLLVSSSLGTGTHKHMPERVVQCAPEHDGDVFTQAVQPQTGLQAFKVLEDCFEWLCSYDARVRGSAPGTPASRDAEEPGVATHIPGEVSGMSTPSTPSTPLADVRSPKAPLLFPSAAGFSEIRECPHRCLSLEWQRIHRQTSDIK